ncbi:MAG: GAF domain-containing protein, partial [Nannocystaceae bacterium]
MDLIHPDDQESTTQALGRLAEADSVVDFRNRYRTKSGEYRWLQWSAYPPEPEADHIFASARVIDNIVRFERELERSNKILKAIMESQNKFIQSGAVPEWWDNVLAKILEITRSEYGFIGVTRKDQDGRYLRTKAITNIAWDDATRRFYEENAPKGMVFRNLNTLFGRPIVDGKVLISNDVANDSRAGGRPHGHPPLNKFAGIPIRDENGMCGLIGIANAPEGYSEEDVEMLQPIIVLLANVLRNIELQSHADETTKQLESVRTLQGRVLESSLTGFLVLGGEGEIVMVNQRAESLIGLDVESSMPPDATDSAALLCEAFCDSAAFRELLIFVDRRDRTRVGPLELRSRRKSDDREPDVELIATWIGEEAFSFPLLLSLNDLRERQALEHSLLVNSQLESRVQQLAQTKSHNETLSECVEFLQTCTSLDEGLELLSRFMARFYPDAVESKIFVVDDSNASSMRELLHTKQHTSVELPVQDCWALRSRRVYSAWEGGHSLHCAHFERPSGIEYCVPLFSLDRVVAVFSLQFSDAEDVDSEEVRAARQSEFVAMGQSIS